MTTTGTSSNSNSNAKSTPASSLPHRPPPLSTSTTGGLKPSISSPGLKSPSSPLAQSVFVAPDTIEKKEGALGPESSTSPVPPSVSLGLAIRAPPQLRQMSSHAMLNDLTNESSSSSLFGLNGSSRSPAIVRSTVELLPSMSSPFGGILPGCKSSLQVGNARISSLFSQKPRLTLFLSRTTRVCKWSTLRRPSSAKVPSTRNSLYSTYDGKKVATIPMKTSSPLLRQ